MRMSEALQRFSQLPVVDAFLLRAVERTVQSYAEARQQKLREFFKAAELRMRAAEELAEAQTAVAFPLYREAALLYMAALVVVDENATVSEPLQPPDVVAQFETLDVKRTCPATPAELADFLSLVAAPDPMALDRLSSAEAFQRMKPVRTIVVWLRESNEPRTLREIKVQRFTRISILTLVVAVGLVWGLIVLFTPKNIALHRPVSLSSVFPGAAVVPQNLTDGVTSGAYAVHTNREDNAWVQVDLQDVYRISKVKIYNRGDGWFDEGLPLTLTFSENGVDFVEVDKRTKSFGQWVPWTFDAGGKKARYIRVHGFKGNGYVTLSELEAFGKK